MSKLLKQMMEFVGFADEEDENEEEFMEVEDKEKEHESRRSERNLALVKKGKVVNINTTAQLQVVVMTPESFDEARDIADFLKTKKPVVINLENIDREISRRIVDFLSGAVYALDGNIQKVSAGIFLVTPYNVSIMGDFKDELRNKGVFPWMTEAHQ